MRNILRAIKSWFKPQSEFTIKQAAITIQNRELIARINRLATEAAELNRSK